jgi:hypothetical protein
MAENKEFYPSTETLGEKCMFWRDTCEYPKIEMQGRQSCEGIIDDVCLYLMHGRIPKSLTDAQRRELKTRIPLGDNLDIPPGDVKP